MAHVNTRPSHVSSTRYGTATPGPGGGSDQENQDPEGNTRRDKGKQRAMPPPSGSTLPTPTSDADENENESRGHKRKRTTIPPRGPQTQSEVEQEEEFTRYFDPNQDPEMRRQVKKKVRALEREFHENREELLRGTTEGLTTTLNRANTLYQKVKQTNEATIDSRLLVNVSDLAYKKTTQLSHGDTSTGVDVDEFLSKCITYMRNGSSANGHAGPSSPRRRTARRQSDSDDEDEDAGGEALNWELLGRNACFPYNSRPPVPSFLLGPLSVEKKKRTQTQRRARLQKDTAGREARPEALTKDDLQQSDANGLTAICTRIRNQLKKHNITSERSLRSAGVGEGTLDAAHEKALLKQCHLADNWGVPLFEYVINPHSFGQSVENMFYVSFLIKEGTVGVAHDSNGLPTLGVTRSMTAEEQRKAKSNRHQAVFALDYETWERLIEAFDITEPMIEHRREEQQTQVGERGWYT
ncbi:hypothetical protein LTR62_002947 [Meristemomyces frigidus]|uniref:Non-structural maintenance of chromosomes element 4 n=1 Tax=Meristemomyces frigidus TaxID=1508187 RepID=A0AAN7TS27_9PEZI|nr:hypothetical protein LTR62_002947 [Meristemomyces frigidus]